MSEPTIDCDPFGVVAESFLAYYRAGERPSIEDYAERHPELAEQIRRLLPVLVTFEQDRFIGPDAAMPPPPAASSKERRLGDYRILREIGRGGMGVVYEAEQVSLGRRVALKVLPGQVSSDRMILERFRREARAAARLHHTNIVPVYDVGQDGDVRFYAMQFIQGQGLDAVITELRRLRDHRAESESRINAVSAGKSQPRHPEHSRHAPYDPTLADGVEVSPVLRSILTGRFDPGHRAPELEGATNSMLARALAGGLAAPTGIGAESSVVEFDPAQTSGEAEATSAGDPTDLLSTKTAPNDLPLSLSASTSSSSTILPGGTQLSSIESGRRGFFRSLAQIGRQVAGGLAYAHARGIVHRDIKPSNLLLDTDGVVWIADFGLAKGDEEGLTQSGDILGTLRYMAPERFRGEGGARADIYALGLTLYELLTLRPGFDSSDRLKLIEQIKTQEPQKPRALDARIPRDLETIVLKAIEKDPKARYQSAEAMCEDLRRFLADEPIRARQISASERYWRWCRRNPIVAGLVVGIALALVVGTAVSIYFAIRATRGEWLAHRNEAKALAYADRALDEKRLSDRRLYQAEISLADQAWWAGQRDKVRHHLESLVPQRPADPDLRGFEWYFLHRLCQSDLTLHGGTSVAYNSDGRTLASAGRDGTVRLWDAGTGQEILALRGHTDQAYDVAFSPDGRTLASAGHDHTITLWDLTTGREVRVLRGHTAKVLVVAYGPDRRTLASGGEDGTVRLWDAATGQPVRILRGQAGTVYRVAYSPDGHTLAAAHGDYTAKLWDTATGQEIRTLRGHTAAACGVAFSPDGRTLASASFDHTVRLWDAATGREARVLRGHTAAVLVVAYGPDGRALASAGRDRTVRLWDLASGRELLTLRGLTADVWGVAFSPDGRTLASASADETIKLWDISGDAEAVTLRGHAAPVLGLAYGPDGRTLASASDDRTVRIWDPATGQEVRTLRGHPAVVWSVAYSPDGRTLASASFDHTVRLWDAANGRELGVLRGHTGKVLVVAYSPDGRTLASAGVDRTVRIWDVDTSHELRVLRGHTDQVNGVSYSPDGRTVASASSDLTVQLWDIAEGHEVRILRGHTDRVWSVAYGPDGRTLASAGDDGTVKLRDAATGQVIWTLGGESGRNRSVAFSPDGRTLASAGDDGTVKLWNTATGQELLTLHGHAGSVLWVAFSPDGRTLASAGADGTVKHWDSTPLTPAARASRQARIVVQSLFDASLPTAQVLACIRHDATLSTAVRQRVLALAEQYGHSRVAHEAERRVQTLYAQAMFRPEVLETLRHDAVLSEPVRREALVLAEQVSENPESLKEASRAVVRQPDAEPATYRLALRQAEAACRLIPQEADFLTTLGMAQYRVGHFRQAVATLTQADRIHRDYWNGLSRPSDLAFLAMARHRCGQTDQARAALSRLREMMKRPQWARSGLAQSFLDEAEVVELDIGFPADPFAPGP